MRKNSSAYDAPATSIATMVDAIANGRRRILPCVAILDGEYGRSDIAMGVPCILGHQGLESVVELNLDENETALFDTSAEQVAANIRQLQ